MTSTKIEFCTREYTFSHGRAPRGYGSWAFDFGSGPVFAPTSTYAEARAWAREQVRSGREGQGRHHLVIEVCS